MHSFCRRRFLSPSRIAAAGAVLAVGALGLRVAAKDLSHFPPRPSRVPPATHTDRDIVAYTCKGDLYTKELPDGPVCRLAQVGRCSQIAWSPTGQWIAIAQCHVSSSVTSYRLQVVSRDGRTVRAFPHYAGSFDWSSRRDQITWKSDQGALFLTDIPTGRVQKITADVGDAEWSPDGETIAYYTDALTLYSLTGRRRVLPVKASPLSWSPDGRFLLYETTHAATRPDDSDYTSSLWVVDRTGRYTRLLYTAGEVLGPDNPVWSPDSKFVLFHALNGRCGSCNADGTAVFACRRDSGRAFRLFSRGYSGWVLRDDDFIQFRRSDARLAISVGGSRFHWETKRIYLVDLAHHTQKPLTPARMAAVYPLWSPNGKNMAFISAPDAAKFDANIDLDPDRKK